MAKPVIGISGSVLIDEGGMFPGYRRSYANEDYVSSVLKNGGVPLLIPMNQDNDVVEQQVNQIDALILSGGQDVSPELYNEEPLQKLGDTLFERDKFDCILLQKAKEKGIPILGICRGCQIINAFHGGNLYQDLSYREEVTYRHWQDHNSSQTTHMIDIDEQSKLYEMLEKNEVQVNSFHHQIIKKVAPNFTAVAKAKDGVVEAIEASNYDFLVGVQWHPEMLHETKPVMNQIFKELIKKTSGG